MLLFLFFNPIGTMRYIFICTQESLIKHFPFDSISIPAPTFNEKDYHTIISAHNLIQLPSL